MALFFNGTEIGNTDIIKFENTTLERVNYKESDSAEAVLVWEAGSVTPGNKPVSSSYSIRWGWSSGGNYGATPQTVYSYTADGNGYITISVTGSGGDTSSNVPAGASPLYPDGYHQSASWSWRGYRLAINNVAQSTVTIQSGGRAVSCYRILKGQTYEVQGLWGAYVDYAIGFGGLAANLTGSYSVTPVRPD